jgi:hypothetical protein
MSDEVDADGLRSVLEMLAGEAFYDGVSLRDAEISGDWRFQKLKRCVQEAAKNALGEDYGREAGSKEDN